MANMINISNEMKKICEGIGEIKQLHVWDNALSIKGEKNNGSTFSLFLNIETQEDKEALF